MPSTDQLIELAADLRDRAMTYAFLARALSDDELGVDFLASLRDDAPETGTELDAFATSLAGMDDLGLEGVRRDLAADHSATLLGMSAHPVSPYESVWTSNEQLMMQASRDEVMRAYAAAGFGKAEGYHVPEDHIALELDFMAGLGNRAAALVETLVMEGTSTTLPADDERLAEVESAVNTQLDFIERHLGAWAPRFCDALETRAATAFYRGVAQMLRTYLADEEAYLKGLAE